MSSEIKADKWSPASGTSATIGDSGDTYTIPSGVTFTNNGTATGFGATINNNADNRVITGSGTANTLEGEANLTFDGNEMTVQGTPVVVGTNSSSVLDLKNTNSSADGRAVGIAFSTNSGGSANAHITAVQDANAKGTLFFGGYDGTSTRNKVMSVNAGSNVVGVGNEGTTGSFSEGYGCQIHTIGYIQSNRDGGSAGAFGRSNDGVVLSLVRGTGGVGSISVNATSTAFNTSSDYRLKENEVAISDGIERLKQLKPYRFNFKTDADKTVDGFFAHEVSSVVPEAIQGEKDGEEMQGIDQSKLVPLLTSALQEAITKIETLEAKVAALESA